MIHRSETNGIVELRLEHGKASAFDLEFVEALEKQIATEENDEAVRAMVLTGRGEIFSAGVDLFRYLDSGDDYVDQFIPAIDRLFARAFHFPKPLIASINGHAIAGGCVLAACADRRLMADGKGRIGAPELSVGVPFPPVALAVLKALLPTPALTEIVLHGSALKAADARARGLVDDLWAPEELSAAALAEAEIFAKIPAVSFRLTKQLMRGGISGPGSVEESYRNPTSMAYQVREGWKTDAVRDAVKRYVEKTFGPRG